MKIRITRGLNCEGSILLVTIMSALIIGIVLVSYLSLVRHQNATVARSQAWNGAMASAEAGVEEAMAQLTSVPLTTNINRSANGWVASGGSYSVPSARELVNGYYTVSFTDVPQPVITATGTNYDKALNAYISRKVEVRTTNAPVFSIGLAALMDVKMNGNNVFTDSYISTNPAYSTGGQYDPTKARKNGDVASVGGLVTVGSGTINGDLFTGPTGSVSTNNSSTITGNYQDDFNAVYEDVKKPTNYFSYTGLSPQTITLTNAYGGGIGKVTYSYVFNASTASYLQLINGGDLTKPLYVAPGADVYLYISGNVSLGNNNIYIAPANGATPAGKLTIYMEGSDFTMGGVENNGTPVQFTYLGMPSNTSIKFNNGAKFTGTIYAPQAKMTFSGGISYSGACVVKEAYLNGNAEFHYDEALVTTGPTIYKAAAWKEL